MRRLRLVMLLLLAICAAVLPVAALADQSDGFRVALVGKEQPHPAFQSPSSTDTPSPVRFTGAETRPSVDLNAKPLQITPEQEAAFRAAGAPPVNPGALPDSTATSNNRSVLSLLGMLGGMGLASVIGVVWNWLDLRRMEKALAPVTLEPASGLRLRPGAPVALMSRCEPAVPHVIGGFGAPPVLTLPRGCVEPGLDDKAPPEIGISVGGRKPEDLPPHNDNKAPAPKEWPNNGVLGIVGLAKDIETGKVYGAPDLSRDRAGSAWPGLNDIVTGALSGNTTMFTDPDAKREQGRLAGDSQRAKDAEQDKQATDRQQQDQSGQQQNQQQGVWVDPDITEQQAKDEQARQQQQQDDINAPYIAPTVQPYDYVDPDVAEAQAKAEQSQQQQNGSVPANQLPQFQGKTADEIRRILTEKGYKNVFPPSSPQQSDIWYEPSSGSRVRIDEYGNKIPKQNSGDDPHVHKEQIEENLVSAKEIKKQQANMWYDDQGNPSTNRDEVHIPLATPADFEAVTGRPLRQAQVSVDQQQPYEYVDPDVAEQQAKDEQSNQQEGAQQQQPYDYVDPDVAEQQAKAEQSQQQVQDDISGRWVDPSSRDQHNEEDS